MRQRRGNAMTIPATDPARTARALPRKPLPVLDVGRARAGDASAVEALAAAWRDVWEDVGFLCIVNHGVGRDLIARMTDAARRFHDLPMETKLRWRVPRDQKGYIPDRAGLTPHSSFHKAKKMDPVEAVVLATDFPDDAPDRLAGPQFSRPTPWPATG